MALGSATLYFAASSQFCESEGACKDEVQYMLTAVRYFKLLVCAALSSTVCTTTYDDDEAGVRFPTQ